MKQYFEVLNIKCEGCANKVKNALREKFGQITIDLSKEPRVISLEVDDKKIPLLREQMKKLGYPFSDEKLSNFENVNTKAKSFVSCAIGKVDLKFNQ
jgi:copper chaperone CopZ